jgi:hypothetical protein
MTLAGLPLTTLLGILGGAAALTIVFYILKLRRRPVAVPFSPLWDAVLRDKESSRLFSQLKRWLSLLLQLLLLLALVLALGDPRPTAALAEGRSVVVLIDASASMKATDVKPSRLALAKDEARKLVRGLSGSDRALVVQMGPVPLPLSTLTSDPTELVPAIDRVAATDTRADFARALDLARDALRGEKRPEIVVLSDGVLEESASPPDLAGITLSYVSLGKTGKNLAITQFSVRRYPLDKSRLEVMVEVANAGREDSEIELSLYGDGALVDSERVVVKAGERLPRFMPDVGGTSAALEARIRYADGREDDLPADDRAYALVPERKRARVLTVTPGNTYLEAALLLDEYLDVTQIAPSAYPAPGAFDVTIFDGVAPPPSKSAGALIYLNSPAEGAPVGHERAIEDFGFDTWDKKSPVLRFAAMGDIQVSRGFALDPGPDDKALGESDQGPILVSGSRGGHSFLALGFDPRSSDFVLRVAWPLFVLNAIDSFGDSDTSYLSSYRTGEVWRLPVPDGARSAELVDPTGAKTELPVQAGRAVYFGDRAGVYQLATGTGADRTVTRFAANLADLKESSILPQTKLALGKREAKPPEGFVAGVRDEVWMYLLAAVLAVSVLEWITYHRRVTV